MTTITFDTLKFANRLKAAGMEPKQALAQAEAQAEILQTNLDDLVTMRDLKDLGASMGARLEKELSPIRTDMAVVKWMIGIVMGGVITLILKAFFPH